MSQSLVNEAAESQATSQDDTQWESQIASLLDDLSSVQTDLLAVLEKKRQALISGANEEELLPLQEQEGLLADRLAECQQRRQDMLSSASEEGLPSKDLRTLAKALPKESSNRLQPAIRDGRARTRLLQHQSLANWVLVQRTLLHLSQMVEIIATGGKKSPIYRKSGPAPTSGALMDFDV